MRRLFGEIGENAGDSLAEGLRSKKAAVEAAARALADGASHVIEGRFEIKSPSRVGIRWGQQIAEGVAIGLQDAKPFSAAAPQLEDNVSGLVDAGAPQAQPAVPGSQGTIVLQIPPIQLDGREVSKGIVVHVDQELMRRANAAKASRRVS